MANATELQVGLGTWSVTVPPEKAMRLRRAAIPPVPTATPREMVRAALEHPHGFEPLRRALTPDDHVTIVFDPTLPYGAELLAGVLDHLGMAGVGPGAVTVLTPPGSSQGWIDELPEEFEDVTAETHDPSDRKKLAYLASTKAGRRVYLNRTLVEADFNIVLTGRRFDPVRFYAGAHVALYPELADDELRALHAGPYTRHSPWGGREESLEVAWLLGTPFLVQIIEGTGDTIQDVVAGLLDSEEEGRRRQDERWKTTVSDRADAVIATVSGDPGRVTFLDLAKAAACAARVVRKGGWIAVLTSAAPDLGEGAELIRTLDEPKSPDRRLAKEKPQDWAACKLWCFAAGSASLFLAGGYPDDLVEELFASPLHTGSEVQRLIDAAGSVLVIPDANKSMVTVE